MPVKRPAPGRSAKILRPAQRRRTRKAIVEAAMVLLARGRTPSVEDVATEADVSRRTVYLYFPSFDQLLLDATAGALSQVAVDQAIASAPVDDVAERVDRMVRAMQHVTPEIERLGRTLLRLTVAAADDAQDGTPRRG